MKIKYRSGYAEGGFLDDGASVDPISGNEVPTGSLAEEVRDDIPAQLSEGEFVVPADVVRFIGLDKLMKMRDSAKAGLADMEAEGQMGGSPAPQEMAPEMTEMDYVDVDGMIDGMEDEVPQFDKGGFVQRDDGSWEYSGPTNSDSFEGSDYSDLMGRNFGTVPTTETMTYINEDGHKIYIPVIDGKPAYDAPEGYTLVASDGVPTDPNEDPSSELEAAYRPSTTNNQEAVDFAQNGGRERQEREIASSQRLGRDRLNNLRSQAKSNMTQEDIDDIWGQMTIQEQSIYEDRMKEPGFLDGIMTKGMAPVDRMLAAVQTSQAINHRKGLAFNKSDTSTYSDKPVDFKKMATVIGSALIKGIPGLLTAAKVGELGVNSTEVLAAAKEFVLSGIGQGSGRTGDEGIQPSAVKPEKYDQKYWRENFYDEKNGSASSAEIAAEQLRIAMETGKGAYGNDLTPEQIKAVNKAAREKDLADQAERTIALRKSQKTVRKLGQDRRDKQTPEVVAAAKKLAEDKAAKAKVTEGGRPTQNQKPANSGGNGDAWSSSAAPEKGSTARSNRGSGRKGRQADASNNPQQNSGREDYAYGGLASKMKPAVKKMRKDPTAGLASKKIAKQKAQAKKGALAAKRT